MFFVFQLNLMPNQKQLLLIIHLQNHNYPQKIEMLLSQFFRIEQKQNENPLQNYSRQIQHANPIFY